MTSGGWIMLNSSVASLPAKVKIASSPPGCSPKKEVTSSTCPSTTTQQSVLLLCLATSVMGAAGAPPATAPPPPPPPIMPITESGAYLPMTSGGWIMLNSSVASLPAKVRMANSPPGCSPRKEVTSSTCPSTTTQQSVLVLCLATSAKLKPPPPPAAGAAAAAAAAGTGAEFILSSYEPPANLELSTAPVRPPPVTSRRSTSFMSAPNMYLAAALPATRPKTTQSNRELPPKRLLPWTPPATSPAAYKPGIGKLLAPMQAESSSISKPPMQ
eukprot:Skav219091  [mRNA]  locus=scaffold1574:117257:118510:- [translate_table: standard]